MGKNRGENFVTAVLMVAIIVIFSVTTYFCLDIFEIIDVPEKYSLVSLLGSKIELSTVAESIEEVLPEEEVKKKVVIDNSTSKNETYTNVQPPTFDVVKDGTTVEGNSSNFGTQKTMTAETEFYYNQLDSYAKVIYTELYNHKEDLKTGLHTIDFDVTFNDLLHEENGAETLENDFQLAVNALVFDKPDIFFLDITKMYLFTEITTFGPKKTYRISIGPNNNIPYLATPFTNKESVENTERQIDEIVYNIGFSSDVYEQIRTAHDYIIENTEYDQTVSKANIYSIYGTLINREAVCEGYAKTFKYIMDKLNIPCIIACGVGQNSRGESESHAWNYVRLEDKWYAVDVTWDDPVIVGYGNATNEMRYQYFLNGSNSFFEDHTEDGNLIGTYRFEYPILSVENYEK